MATLATARIGTRRAEGASGNRVAEIRQARGLPQEELAARIGCTKSQLSRLENGRRGLTREWLGRLAAALDVPPEELLGEPSLFSLTGGARPPAGMPFPAAGERGGPESGFGGGFGGAFDEAVPSSERTLPLCGLGQWGLPEGVGLFHDTAQAPERVWCPAPLARIRGAYAVRMPDGSMWPKYAANQILFVHPLRAPQPGTPVVVRAEGRFLVAAFVGAGPETVRLERYHPARQFEIERRAIRSIDCIVASEER